MRSVSACVAVWLVLAAAAECAPGGDQHASGRLIFGGSSSQERAPAPRTVTRLLLQRHWVTSVTPSSCVVVQTSLPACRNLRQLGAAIRPSVTVSRIEPTKAATLDEVEGGAEGRTLGWIRGYRGSSTEAAPAPAPAYQVVSGATPQLVLQESMVGDVSGGGGQTVVVEERPPALQRVQLAVAQQQPAADRTFVLAEPAPAQAQPVTRTLVLQQPSNAHAQQVVFAQPQDAGGQQFVYSGAGEQAALHGATIVLQGAEPQQQVVTLQKGDGAHRYSWGEWLGFYSPEEKAPAPARGTGGAGADGVVTVVGTLLQTATRAHVDREHVVTFSVTGCEPTRLPFDLDYCEGQRPSKGAPNKNVITIQEVAEK